MKPSELEVGVWYVDRDGKQFQVIAVGSRIRWQNQRGDVGETDAEGFAAKLVMKA